MPETTFADEMAGGLRPVTLRARVLAVVAALAILLAGGATFMAAEASAQPATGSSIPAADVPDPWLDVLTDEDLLLIWQAIIDHDPNGPVAAGLQNVDIRYPGPGYELLWAAILAATNRCAVMPWAC